MSTASMTLGGATIRRRIRDIQATWSPQERRRRAATARRRISRLLSFIGPQDQAEPEIWAVGSPADCDLARCSTWPVSA